MRRYILGRLIRSILSIIVVVGIIFVLIYTLVPRENIFLSDPTYVKMSGADNKTNYRYQKYEQFGYLDYVKFTDVYKKSQQKDQAIIDEFVSTYESQGYTIEYLSTGVPYAYKNVSTFKLMLSWFGDLIQIDGTWKVKDEDNPDLERKLYFSKTMEGAPVLACSGCEHKYMIWFDSTVPFIHTHFIDINLGISYPLYANKDIVNTISAGQGGANDRLITFPTGVEQTTDIDEYSLTYVKTANLTGMDKLLFTDNYARYTSSKLEPSMLANSFTIGVFATILAYILGLPIGLLMAKNKGKIIDKIGIAYIVVISSVPSLAYIFFVKLVGIKVFGLPADFVTLGPFNILSYISPVISLALPSIAGLMMWMRRYMIDQSSSDYVKFARSKGLSDGEIFTRHIMRNASIPIIQRVPISIVACLVGALMTESVYSIGGMGKMMTGSIQNYDNTLVVALVFFYTMLSVFSLFLGDLLIAIVDPRISFSSKGGRK